MTHDLLRDVVDALGPASSVSSSPSCGRPPTSPSSTSSADRRTLNVSSRPSDAVALAVRTGSPLFVADDLMDAEGILLPTDDEDEDGDRRAPTSWWGSSAQFLDTVRPEDFSS